jgi:hypothetical protein
LELARHALGGRGVPCLEVGPDQAVLAAECAVQRGLRDPGVLGRGAMDNIDRWG